MSLTLLKVRAGITSLIFFTAILVLAVPAMPQTPPTGPCVDQSPRNLNMQLNRTDAPAQGYDYNFVSGAETVKPLDENRVEYQRIVLELCDRHYHSAVENDQGCQNEKAHASALAEKKSGPSAIGPWVEVHKVYAAGVDRTGDCSIGHDHDLKCCVKPPFVVLGYAAKIDQTDRIPTPANFAEWTGSATSEPATQCNTTPARWQLTLSCDTRLTSATLERTVGGKPHSARGVQGPNLVSTDLTFVGPSYMTEVCRKVSSTQPIPDEAAAQRICPGICKWPLNRFNGAWSNSGGSGLCGCCPLQRPQQ
jgi:hypothetical protein